MIMTTTIPTQIDKCKGAMLCTAIGDALGWPNEQRAKNKNKSSKVNDYFIEWTRRNNKPCYHDEKILPGEYSDDTQLTLSVARSIIAGNWENFLASKELPFWLKYERGGGGALLNAAKSCEKGVLSWKSNNTQYYFNAGGNGAVMRILPHVIANAQKPDITSLLVNVIKDTIITHGHPRAILGATCYAFALNYFLKKDSVLEYGELVTAVIDGQSDWGNYPNSAEFGDWLKIAHNHCDFEYIDEWSQVRSNMINQLEFIQTSLKKGLILDDTNVLTHLGCFSKANGAGDVAILAAIYLASRYANNPALGIKVPAFSFGADTDTIASITGGLLGMLCGTSWIPTEWKVVQDYEGISRITDFLLTDNKNETAKLYLSEVKTQDFNWINTKIGLMRIINTSTVQNGKYSIVNITKWESALGQTLYRKDVQKLDKQTSHQSSLNDLIASHTTVQQPSQLKSATPTQKPNFSVTAKLQFVMDGDSIAKLLSDTQFKNNITIGKVMRIVQTLIEGKKTSEMIAKQYKVELAMVDLIKTHITQ